MKTILTGIAVLGVAFFIYKVLKKKKKPKTIYGYGKKHDYIGKL